jgi:hypothetical protein
MPSPPIRMRGLVRPASRVATAHQFDGAEHDRELRAAALQPQFAAGAGQRRGVEQGPGYHGQFSFKESSRLAEGRASGAVYSRWPAPMQENHADAPHAVLIRHALHGYGMMLQCSVVAASPKRADDPDDTRDQ